MSISVVMMTMLSIPAISAYSIDVAPVSLFQNFKSIDIHNTRPTEGKPHSLHPDLSANVSADRKREKVFQNCAINHFDAG